MLTPAASRRLRFHHADSKKPSSVFSQMKQLPFAEAKLSRIMSRACELLCVDQDAERPQAPTRPKPTVFGLTLSPDTSPRE